MTDSAIPTLQGRHHVLDRFELALVGLVVFLSPMNYLRVDSFYLTFGDVAGFMAFFLILATGRLPLRPLGPATPVWLASFLLMISGLLIGSFVNGDPVAGTTIALQYSYSLILLPVLICARPYAQIVLLAKIFVLSITVIMIFGIFWLEFGDLTNWRLVSPSGRLRSLIERENGAATMCGLAVTFLVWLTLTGRWSRLTGAVLAVPIVYGLLLTGSNTGLAVATVGVGSVIFFSGSFVLFSIGLVLVSLIAATTYFWGDLFLPDVFQRRVFAAIQQGDLNQAGTFSDRWFLIREAMDIANSHVLIGLGADQHRLISAHGAPVHNTYLLMLTEGGLLSLVGLVGLLASGLYLGWLSLRQGGYMRGVMTLTIILLYMLLLNAFAHFYARFWIIPLALALGISASVFFDRSPHLERRMR
ncbi:O-antigen ligase family protein [Oceanomicrobium pacificus]|uniref:O-antigen ligase-related domain-containing protein n=1 Tax=Oceanomicrobium pacificus TaxID=2692916 RepID=A0A6B0U2G8_9RHOB|nr:O-antigen ligase family protein [Oceanomicrobium pacificus]MXU65211.1 hypothetical protein [Oceanomicrobium pacificus]